MTNWYAFVIVAAAVVSLFALLFELAKQRRTRVAQFFACTLIISVASLAYYRDALRKMLGGESENPPVTSSPLSTAPNHVPNPASASSRPIEVPSRQEWTPTDVIVEKGQTVTVKATGEVRFSDHDPLTGPDGEGKPCYPNPKIYRWTFPAQDLSCHSLLGRIGEEGTVFEIGSMRRFRADFSGRFYLGVNDNWFPDNSGSWWADVSVSAVQQADMH